MHSSILFAAFALGILALPATAAEVKVEKSDSALTFSTEGRVILSYQMEAGKVPEGVPEIFRHGAHLHPIFSPSGKMVTGNHPPDHPWHRGVWMAWTKTELGSSHPDFWNLGKGDGPHHDAPKLSADVRFDGIVKNWAGLEGGGFVSRHRFVDLSGDKETYALNETWEVVVKQASLDGKLVNLIDLASTQVCAGEVPLKLPKYHYGGLGVRGNQLWNSPNAVTMLTSEGHDRKSGDSTTARWVYLGGQVDGGPTGLAILIHSDNFRFPQPLRLNPDNPQLSIAPSQGGDWSIEPGKPLISRYRILTFDGAPDAKWIEAQWTAYAGRK